MHYSWFKLKKKTFSEENREEYLHKNWFTGYPEKVWKILHKNTIKLVEFVKNSTK